MVNGSCRYRIIFDFEYNLKVVALLVSSDCLKSFNRSRAFI